MAYIHGDGAADSNAFHFLFPQLIEISDNYGRRLRIQHRFFSGHDLLQSTNSSSEVSRSRAGVREM